MWSLVEIWGIACNTVYIYYILFNSTIYNIAKILISKFVAEIIISLLTVVIIN